MNRFTTLSLTLATALAAQLALSACSKHEAVTTDSPTSASAPDATAASAAPMDSGASGVAGAASDAAMAASR
jgi:hypothetical protein